MVFLYQFLGGENMKIKVTKRYVDKYTKKIVEEGTETEMTAERGKELIKEGVAKEVKVTGKEE